MEDFIGLIVIALFYLLSAKSKSKKKKRRMRTPDVQPYEQAFSAAVESAKKTPAAAAKPERVREEAAHAQGNEACRSERMHLHEATGHQLSAAGEGEDPCHQGGEQEDSGQPEEDGNPADVYASEETDDKDALAQDVLRGVIMSEILLRPDQRRAMQKNRWRA